MGYKLSPLAFDYYLKALRNTYRIFAPVLQKGKGKFAGTDVISYGEINSLDDIMLDRKSYFSPKEVLYPIRETLFYFLNDETKAPAINVKPILILVRPCDLNGIGKLDRVFLNNGQEVDFYYARRRELIKFAMIECVEGFDTCFCVSMDSNVANNYDMAVRFDEDNITVKVVDKSLITKDLTHADTAIFEPAFIQENKVKVTIPEVDLVTKKTFDHELWEEYTSRCIACGRCNTSCITCSCYTMQDIKLSDDKKIGERRRVWAGCHIDGFTNMAGGHNFRKKNGEKMRFKTMHKINDFYKRFNEHMCVGCGRCDDVCPEYISFSKCINKLNAIVREETLHE
ncbi:MAG: anaerobic sulfite reductase subunit AsrA [Desulfobacteraceae bacterium]|nr:anaerobic sulfite reductase subunit AsrA [Desulfobacteraceae bacterium]